MSRFERAYCCSAVWRSSSSTIARELAPNSWAATCWKSASASGSVAQQLLSSNPEIAWTAMDIDPHMTQAAATRLHGFPNASVKTADATAMPFPDDSFDSVVSCLMLHHIIDWERAVAEVARVLRPGGTFVGYDLTRTPLASLFHRLDGSPHRLLVPDDFRDRVRTHGLTIKPAVPAARPCHALRRAQEHERKTDGTVEYSRKVHRGSHPRSHCPGRRAGCWRARRCGSTVRNWTSTRNWPSGLKNRFRLRRFRRRHRRGPGPL